MTLFATPLLSKKFFSLFITAFTAASLLLTASAQTVTVSSGNPDSASRQQPFGSYYGFERTDALYLSSEIGTSGYITQVGFYVNSLNNPAASTPVVIKMKTTTSSTLSSVTYATASAGATTVWSGNITSGMLSEDSWVTVTLNTPFNYSANNLEVLVETNYGGYGGETFDGKQFRHNNVLSNRCQIFYEDSLAPTDLGVLSTYRPNIQLTFVPACSGTPNPGNTLTTSDTVCAGSLFTLSIQNPLSGVTYQWESSPTGAVWTPVSTNATYTTSQTALTHYRCVVTCTSSGFSATSTEVIVYMESFYYCYCASYAVTTEDTKIDSVVLGDISTGSDAFQCESYTDYTAYSTLLTPGQPNTLRIKNGSCTGDAYNAYVAVYIDYNHNAAFTDNSELAYSYGPITILDGIPDATFFVPVTAQAGITGMRIVLQEGGDLPLSCGAYTRGETEDYLVDISAVSLCTGTPPAVSTLSTLYSICPGQPFTLSLESYPAASGISYAWQYSLDGIGGWTSIAGAISYTWTDTIARYYRCKITCTNGGGITYSSIVQITLKPDYACYCSSYATELVNDTKIDTVKFGAINVGSDPNHCESYTDNTNFSTDLTVGTSTPIHIVNGSCDGQFYEAYVAVYIDYNSDGDYSDATELAYSFGPTTGLNTIPLSASITVPANATSGPTGMRVILQEGDSVPAPCGLYQWGETEDYVVNIVNTVCVDPPNPGLTTADVESLCASALPVTVTVTLSEYSVGSGQTYQWEKSTDGNIWTAIPGQTTTIGTDVILAGGVTTYYRCQVHCGNTTLPSASDTVTVTPAPIGDTFIDPILVPAGFPYTHFNNNFAANCYTNNYVGQPSPDVYYKLTTTNEPGYLEVSTCNTATLNTWIYILDSNGDEIHSNNNNGDLCNGNFASDSFYVFAVNQTFYVVVEGNNSDEGTFVLDLHFITATGENSISNAGTEISLFPNPNTGTFNLSFDLQQNVSDVATVSITNSIGQLIDEEKVTLVNGKLSKEISLDDKLSNGLYLVNIRVNDLVLTKRFILQD